MFESLRLNKQLLVQGQALELAGDRVDLGLRRIGQGWFATHGASPAQGARAEFFVRLGDAPAHRIITGQITETRSLGPHLWAVNLVEDAVALNKSLTLRLGHCTPRHIAAALEYSTKLKLLLPLRAPYLDREREEFQYRGNGISLLQYAERIWNLHGLVWSMLPSGQLYWGPWQNAPFSAGKLRLKQNLIRNQDDDQHTLDLPYIPALRPGVLVRDPFPFRIERVIFHETQATIHWRPIASE